MDSKYKELFNKSADASLIINNGLFVDCNQATVDMLGFKTKADVLNTHPSVLSPEFQPDGQDSASKADEMMALAYENGSHRFEWNHLGANGEIFPVEVLLTAISREEGNQTLFTVWRDLTDAKENQRFQDATYDLARKLSTHIEMDEIAEIGAEQIRHFFESDSISINFIDHKGGINRGLYTEDTLEGDTEPTTFEPLSTSFDKLDADSIQGIPKPLLLNRTKAEIKAKTLDRPFGAVSRKSASLMFAPIVWDDTKVGEVTAQSYSFEKYSENNLTQLQVLATQIGGAFLRAKASDDLKNEHKELRKNQSQLLLSQQLAHIGSWEYDVRERELYWSEELYNIFDLDPLEPVTLRRLYSRIHPRDLELFKQELQAQTSKRTDYRIIRSDGSIRWIHEVLDEPRLKNGEVVLSRGCAQDVTSSKEAEERLAESDKLRELLLDIITHDLKNPAGVIFSLSELAIQQMPDNKLVDVLHSTSERLLKVLDETTLLTQATFGEKIPLHKLDLSTLLTEVVEEFSSRLTEASITLEVNVPEQLMIYANPLISEVFKNYISNAIKYAGSGKRIIINAELKDDVVAACVSDFGDAIPAFDRKRIFERNTRINSADQKGRGLGLAIVQRIAAVNDAEVWVEPNEPRGNRFCVRIPVPPKN
ncbi:MAG: PAS domain S-box protein [Candidatus Marinimicrobia bacterium]|nr:PAS domain S-box protein [Candidatus Neomarinimicrobiota bacterium]